jgi:hypothetical protein
VDLVGDDVAGVVAAEPELPVLDGVVDALEIGGDERLTALDVVGPAVGGACVVSGVEGLLPPPQPTRPPVTAAARNPATTMRA